MGKFFKCLSVIGLLFSFIVFSFVGYAQIEVEDDLVVQKAEDIRLSGIYSAELKNAIAVQKSKEEMFDAEIMVFGLFPAKNAKVTVSKRRYVVPGGDIFGIKLYTQGLIVTKIGEVKTDSATVCPGKDAGIEVGDTIISVNGERISENSRLEEIIKQSKGQTLNFTVRRNDKEKELELTPRLDSDDKAYRLGLWVRDSCAGIGTITFYDRDTGNFGGLGHAVCDVDTGQIMPLSGGEAMGAEISSCYKGNSGSPGELCGVFTGECIGKLNLNCETGIYGVLKNFDKNKEVIPVAQKQEVKEGKAQIISTVDKNKTQYYDVEITKIYSSKDSKQKNMSIKITDPDLIEKTGGIVQGMSGSPIIQNGMLVGAVTHVYVDDPLQGYAIFAENMVKKIDENADKTSNDVAA